MKFAVIGAGAIGGFLGARLALAGEDVTFVARGANLEAIRRNGFRLIEEDGTERLATSAKARAIDEPGAYDVIFLAVKAQQVAGLARDLSGLLGPETEVVTLQNGVPWWFFYKLGGPYEGRQIHVTDPDGVIAANIAPERIIGASRWASSTGRNPTAVAPSPKP
jgi:2-dehydropantoate 2-reductase